MGEWSNLIGSNKLIMRNATSFYSAEVSFKGPEKGEAEPKSLLFGQSRSDIHSNTHALNKTK